MAGEKVVIVRMPLLKPFLWNPGGFQSGGNVSPAKAVVVERGGGTVGVARLKNAGGL